MKKMFIVTVALLSSLQNIYAGDAFIASQKILKLFSESPEIHRAAGFLGIEAITHLDSENDLPHTFGTRYRFKLGRMDFPETKKCLIVTINGTQSVKSIEDCPSNK